MVKRQTISDLITIDEVKNWNKGKVITITAPTGSGKSYFIKNRLYEIAKENNQKIILLVHRTRCKQQFIQELEENKKLDVIDVVTYQTLENRKDFDISKYDYIVCDEFHYFTSDSEFNYKTDISLEKILGQTNKVRIFMSATPKLINAYIKHRKIETKAYELEKDFTWMNLNFFNKKANSIKTIIDGVLDKNEKALIFIDDLNRCYDLYRDYKDYSLFCCSENKSHYRYVDEEAIEKMLQTEKFDKNLLITTNVLDAGVNIRDNKIKTVICSIRDIGVLIQCLGRKRREDGERVDVYIENINNCTLGGMIKGFNNALEMARDLENLSLLEWTNKYSKKDNKYYGTLVYDVADVKKVNELMRFKILEKAVTIELMLGSEKMKGIGYKKYLADYVFNIPYKNYETYYMELELEEVLENIVGKKLFKEEQKELKEVFAKCGLKARTLGINTLNGYLKDNKMNFVINIPIRKSYRDENGKIKKEKTHWMVGRIVY